MIRILEDGVINKIAAGEVVERPASVVKELLENALDAGATRIEVALKSGGRSLVRVTDDGSGMDRQDALLSIERHATSKIRSDADLFAVDTLGFRGEALPSIAAVSRFELVTRRQDEEVGTRVRLDGGRLLDVEPAGGAGGTQIDVRSLFFNVPARRKFLRTEATELAHALDAVMREAMIRPGVGFTVLHDDREVLRAEPVATRGERIRALLGEHGDALVPVAFEDRGFRVEGLVSPVGVHKGAAAGSSWLYVNRRFVRDAVVKKGVNEAYRGIVPKGRYPVVVLEVQLDPGRVDVNVHPSKTEVRFRDPWDLVKTLSEGLRAALEGHGLRRPVERAGPTAPLPAPPSPLALPLPARFNPSGRAPSALSPHPDDDPRFARSYPTHTQIHQVIHEPEEEPFVAAPSALASPREVREGPSENVPPLPPDGLLPVARFRDLRVIGQLAATYVLCEGAGELVLVDQHAAHERITLHRLQSDRDARIGGAQRLLTPVRVELPRARAEILREHLDLLAELHLEVEPFGPSAFAVTGVPAMFGNADLAALLADLADELATGERSRAGADVVDHALATMACHGSVRAAQTLSTYEMRALLASLDEVDFSVCAHGRPVAIRISGTELEHRFHRS
jgi:DNA mismatch repair protein MutL